MKRLVLILLISNSIFAFTQNSIRAIYTKEISNFLKIDKRSVQKKDISKVEQVNNFMKKSNYLAAQTLKKLEFELKIKDEISIFEVINVGLVEDEKGYSTGLVRGINTKGIYYSNAEKQESIHQKELFKELFLVKQPFLIIKWKLKNESRKIGKFNCFNATGTIVETSSKGISKTLNVNCWYTTEIPTNLGPAGFNGLPGLIVRLEKGNTVLNLKEVTISQKKITINKPKEGIKVESQEEFEKKGKALYYKNIGKRRKKN